MIYTPSWVLDALWMLHFENVIANHQLCTAAHMGSVFGVFFSLRCSDSPPAYQKPMAGDQTLEHNKRGSVSVCAVLRSRRAFVQPCNFNAAACLCCHRLSVFTTLAKRGFWLSLWWAVSNKPWLTSWNVQEHMSRCMRAWDYFIGRDKNSSSTEAALRMSSNILLDEGILLVRRTWGNQAWRCANSFSLTNLCI